VNKTKVRVEAMTETATEIIIEDVIETTTAIVTEIVTGIMKEIETVIAIHGINIVTDTIVTGLLSILQVKMTIMIVKGESTQGTSILGIQIMLDPMFHTTLILLESNYLHLLCTWEARSLLCCHLTTTYRQSCFQLLRILR
jgi:hypothetical protein